MVTTTNIAIIMVGRGFRNILEDFGRFLFYSLYLCVSCVGFIG